MFIEVQILVSGNQRIRAIRVLSASNLCNLPSPCQCRDSFSQNVHMLSHLFLLCHDFPLLSLAPIGLYLKHQWSASMYHLVKIGPLQIYRVPLNKKKKDLSSSSFDLPYQLASSLYLSEGIWVDSSFICSSVGPLNNRWNISFTRHN